MCEDMAECFNVAWLAALIPPQVTVSAGLPWGTRAGTSPGARHSPLQARMQTGMKLKTSCTGQQAVIDTAHKHSLFSGSTTLLQAVPV
jgi:hypothetical protein